MIKKNLLNIFKTSKIYFQHTIKNNLNLYGLIIRLKIKIKTNIYSLLFQDCLK